MKYLVINISMTNSYCPLPFAHTTISTAGNYEVCCSHVIPNSEKQSIYNTDHQSWFSGAYMQNLREALLNNQLHPGCRDCWKTEALGLTSYRQQSLEEYRLLKADADNPQLINLEVQMGNTCNLGCLMCSERSSSYINRENQQLGLEHVNQQDYTFKVSQVDRILELVQSNNVKVLNIRGGEPFYSKPIYEFLRRIPTETKKRLVLHITTNATTWSSQWQELLSEFRLIRFMFSLDATEQLYNYIRYPGRWDTTESNIYKIMQMKNAKFLINCVVQNLNVMNLQGIFEFALRNQIHLTLTPISTPEYLGFTNLPVAKAELAISRIDRILTMQLGPALHHTLTGIRAALLDANDSKWADFVEYITKKDQHRGTNFEEYLI